MFTISISSKLGKKPVIGLKTKALNPLSFKLVTGNTSGSPIIGSHVTKLQSSGILIACFPIRSTAAGALKLSKNTNGTKI